MSENGSTVNRPSISASSQERRSVNFTAPVITALYSEDPNNGILSVISSRRGRSGVPRALTRNAIGPVTSSSRGILSRSSAIARATTGTWSESNWMLRSALRCSHERFSGAGARSPLIRTSCTSPSVSAAPISIRVTSSGRNPLTLIETFLARSSAGCLTERSM